MVALASLRCAWAELSLDTYLISTHNWLRRTWCPLLLLVVLAELALGHLGTLAAVEMQAVAKVEAKSEVLRPTTVLARLLAVETYLAAEAWATVMRTWSAVLTTAWETAMTQWKTFC